MYIPKCQRRKILIFTVSSVEFLRSEPGGVLCSCVKGVGAGQHKVTAFFPLLCGPHYIYIYILYIIFFSPFTLKMLLQHSWKYADSWRPLDGLPAGEEDIRLLSLLIMCMLRASDKPTSQDGSEKVERNAPLYQHGQRCRSETGTHTHQRPTSNVYLPATKGCKHKPLQQGPPQLPDRLSLLI